MPVPDVLGDLEQLVKTILEQSASARARAVDLIDAEGSPVATLDGEGVVIIVTTDWNVVRAYRFSYEGSEIGGLYGREDAGTAPDVRLVADGMPLEQNANTSVDAQADGSHWAQTRLQAISGVEFAYVNVLNDPLAAEGSRKVITLAAEQVITGADTKLGGKVGFYGTNPQSRPTVTGSRGGNEALASLLAALAGLGLITDSTT